MKQLFQEWNESKGKRQRYYKGPVVHKPVRVLDIDNKDVIEIEKKERLL